MHTGRDATVKQIKVSQHPISKHTYDSTMSSPQKVLHTQPSDEDLLAMAGQCRAIGRTGRNKNGTLTDYYEWAESHPQKDLTVTIKSKSDFGSLERGRKLSVVSWNLLSDTWYRKERAEEYPHTSEEQGAWEYRLPRMIEWFQSLNADVITLQEVDYSLFDTLEASMKEIGYHGLIQQQKKKARNKQPCGNATFWKSFLILESSAAFSRSLATVLKYKQDSNMSICVINVHLEASQSHEGADRRARQLKSPLEWASRLEKGNLPLVVSGDCNTGGDSALFTIVRNYQWHGHDLASAYEHPCAENSMPTSHGTFCEPGHNYIIDHLWYSHDLLQLEHILDPLTKTERDIVSREGLPNETCPSDHIPIGAVFTVVDQPVQESKSSDLPKELSEEQREAIANAYRELMVSAPASVKGKPSPELLLSLKQHSTAMKAWIESYKDPAERDFAKALRTNKWL